MLLNSHPTHEQELNECREARRRLAEIDRENDRKLGLWVGRDDQVEIQSHSYTLPTRVIDALSEPAHLDTDWMIEAAFREFKRHQYFVRHGELIYD